jgi:hypothetical protein
MTICTLPNPSLPGPSSPAGAAADAMRDPKSR